VLLDGSDGRNGRVRAATISIIPDSVIWLPLPRMSMRRACWEISFCVASGNLIRYSSHGGFSLVMVSVTLGLYRNRSVGRIKGNQATFDNSQRNNLRSFCSGVFLSFFLRV